MENRAILLAVVALAVMASAATVQAQQGVVEFTGLGGNAAWSNTANWETLPDPDPSVDPSSRFRDPLDPNLVGTNRLPLSSETAFLRNAVTATLSSGTNILAGLYVGGREYRVPAQQSGTVTPKGSSTMVMSGGSLCITYGSLWTTAGTLRAAYGTFVVGDYYDGRFIQLGGTVSTDFIDIGMKDPSGDMSVRPTGYYRMDSGLITDSGTTTMRIRVGSAGPNNMPGGAGTLVINGGAILPPTTLASGQKRPYVDVAGGTLGAQYRAYGSVAINGGSFETENWGIGLTKGDGFMTITGGTIVNTDMITAGYGAESNGTITQTGGNIQSNLRAGWGSKSGDAYGQININGGTTTIGSGLSLGWGAASATDSYTGYGELNVRQTDPNVPTLVDITGTVGDITLGAGDNKSSASYAPAPGVGVVNVYGGSMAVSGAATDFILGGQPANNRPGTQSRGTLNFQGGSFVTNGGIQFTPTYVMGDGTPGGDLHGVMRVGRNAYVFINGVLSMNGGTAGQSSIGNTSKLILEVSATKSSMIEFNDVPFFADTLRVEGAGGWRPKENNSFAVMHNNYVPLDFVCFHGSFVVFESNLIGGSQHSDPNDPNSSYLPLWSSMIDPNDLTQYIVKYIGLTSGDANGDHVVDGGDLALMGGAWMQSGKDWAHADFTGDGSVDGGDLALIGGNWNWSLSPAPGSGEALPEPATLALLSLGAVSLIRRRRT
jgi:hypothetical protein